MKSAPPSAKTTRKASKKPQKAAAAAAPNKATSKVAAASWPAAGSDDAADDDDDDESEGDEEYITEATMAKLLEALGPEGVEEALAELNAAADDDDDDDDDEDDDGEFDGLDGEELSEDDVGEIPLAELADLSAAEESSEAEEGEDDDDMDAEEDAEEDEEGGLALDELDDDDEADEDAVPYQKVTIFNKVGTLVFAFLSSLLLRSFGDRPPPLSSLCFLIARAGLAPVVRRVVVHALTPLFPPSSKSARRNRMPSPPSGSALPILTPVSPGPRRWLSARRPATRTRWPGSTRPTTFRARLHCQSSPLLRLPPPLVPARTRSCGG
jgi:hypothetical protein